MASTLSLTGSNPSRAARGAKDSSARAWLRALENTASIAKNPGRILSDVIEEFAGECAAAPALLSTRECLTYGALDRRANQYTRWALEQGLGAGGTVCLMMPNRPEYMAIWLGITRTGCAVALLNTNLSGVSLAHSINAVAPKHIIVASELSGRFNGGVAGMPQDLAGAPAIWIHGAGQGLFPRIDREIEGVSGERLRGAERRPVTIADRALYIYTSGTTGMPKAANISHARLMQWSLWFAGLMHTQPNDRLYNCLPMYHSVGGVLATGAVLASGGSVAIRESFSATQFWSDVVLWDCTLFQYIGELCRYLLNTPPNLLETEHRLRMCCGNGLRPDIWEQFASRFHIPRILEFYAATEGNVSLFNVEGKPGAIGRVPSYLAHRFPTEIVRFDVDKEEPVRDERGFCVRCAADETGEAIGRISEDRAHPGNRFEGYTSRQESEKKVLRNVFEPGDAWFRTGDLMRRDAAGYFYFADRIGDTYRWKGENVSTSEVAEAISAFPGIEAAAVYGVRVAGADGRAGMAAVAAAADIDFAVFRRHLDERLPGYAQPVFVRVSRNLAVTSTYKHTKGSLAGEGYDPSATNDAIYFNSRQQGAFIRLDRELYERIRNGEVRL